MKYLIVKASTLNKFPIDKKYLKYEIDNPPCSEASLIECTDKNGNVATRYIIEKNTIDGVYFLSQKYDYDIAISRKKDELYPLYITLILLDEPLKTE